jgi:hypothetical protein
MKSHRNITVESNTELRAVLVLHMDNYRFLANDSDRDFRSRLRLYWSHRSNFEGWNRELYCEPWGGLCDVSVTFDSGIFPFSGAWAEFFFFFFQVTSGNQDLRSAVTLMIKLLPRWAVAMSTDHVDRGPWHAPRWQITSDKTYGRKLKLLRVAEFISWVIYQIELLCRILGNRLESDLLRVFIIFHPPKAHIGLKRLKPSYRDLSINNIP